ncbi:MAG TPA: 2-dehydro-3-deoxy-6-phosphogalactonate aldolase [Pararhizobium sp.]|nr:2-dehydro-3-deoxy-6-phosphogalactonate aldolase [Pararhizobium sp.]
MTKVAWPQMKRSLVAILRGIRPDEIEAAVDVLVEAGFTAIEIPLNSPDPFRSIETAVKVAPSGCLVGAGTVLTTADVDRLHDIGGRLVVSPNTAPAVIERASGFGMATMPGMMTPTEAFTAIEAGASALKFFPASVLGPSGIAAIKAVLPGDAEIGAVGGVSEEGFADYAKVGVRTFGLGSSLYKPGMAADEIASRAAAAVRGYDHVFGGE